MAKYRSDVRTQSRSFLDEATAADWTDAELNRLINVYYHKVRSAVVSVFEDYYITTDTFDTVADQQEYTSAHGLATDIYKIRRVEVSYDPNASTIIPTRCFPIHNIDAIRRDLNFASNSLGVRTMGNGHYYTYGFGSNMTIGFIPVPSENGTDAVKMWYIPLGTDLSDDTTALNIPNPDQNFIIVAYGVVAEALGFGQQEPTEATRFEGKFERGIAKLQEELENYIAEESKMIIDVTASPFDF